MGGCDQRRNRARCRRGVVRQQRKRTATILAVRYDHSAMPPPLRCACLVDQRGSTLLLVRVRQNQHWYLPGGKIEGHESPQSALQRELSEELGIQLCPNSVEYLYTVVGPAYGQPGLVELVCFSGEWSGKPQAQGEVSEVRWLELSETCIFAPAVQRLCAEYLRVDPPLSSKTPV
jgi:8-oxo-dGTP pyrophosphatase MutT (NUDIX family)